MTILGTRPEIIRLSVICPELDKHCDQTIVHTGQNYDLALNDIFYQELGLRPPDVNLNIHPKGFANQIGEMIPAIDEAISKIEPDRILILGDTNSMLAAAIVSARRLIPMFHLEAGNRCFDNRVPEEVNRRIIDHCATIALPYTHRSKDNLVQEGIDRHCIFVVGNPINQVLRSYEDDISKSDVLERLSLEPKRYLAATMHRAENIDDRERLTGLLYAMSLAGEKFQMPIIMSLHPHTEDNIKKWGIEVDFRWLQFHQPFGFFDFVMLERNAACLITDSGTVQEEGCILGIPNITIRDSTERPETIECGSNILTGASPDSILMALNIVIGSPRTWTPPPEYLAETVALTVSNVVLGYNMADPKAS